MTDYASLTPQQVRNLQHIPTCELPMETFAKSVKHYYSQRYIIPNWSGANHQMFYKQSDGTWMDTYNEVTRSQAWIDEHIAPYYKQAPEGISLIDYLKLESGG